MMTKKGSKRIPKKGFGKGEDKRKGENRRKPENLRVKKTETGGAEAKEKTWRPSDDEEKGGKCRKFKRESYEKFWIRGREKGHP